MIGEKNIIYQTIGVNTEYVTKELYLQLASGQSTKNIRQK